MTRRKNTEKEPMRQLRAVGYTRVSTETNWTVGLYMIKRKSSRPNARKGLGSG